MTLFGADVSNHQGPPGQYRGQLWYQVAEFVIAQAIDPPAPFAGHDVGGYTAEQLRAAKADEKYAGVYVWLWNSFSTSAATKADIAARLALIPVDVPLDMRLWLDMEDTTQDHGPARQQDVLDALEVMDDWSAARGLPAPGCYSGDWYLRGYMDAWFPPDRVYWQANYALSSNEAADALLPMRPVIQYTSTPIDQNAMLDSEIVNRGGEPVSGECEELQAKVDSLVNALGYIAGDVLKPLTLPSAGKYVKTAVSQIRAVAEQQGIAHA
jgi:hypothetical protein